MNGRYVILITCMMLCTMTLVCADAPRPVIYGVATYDGNTVDDIIVTVNITNSTTYDLLTDITYNGGKYQVDTGNSELGWDTGEMEYTVMATYNGKTKTSGPTTFTDDEELIEQDIVIYTRPSDDDDDDDDDEDTSSSSSSSTTTGTTGGATYIVALAGIVIFAFIAALGYFLFAPKPQVPMPKKKTVTKTKYSKSGIEMEEYSQDKNE